MGTPCNSCNLPYVYYSLFASMVHNAGPDLNPGTVEAGLFAQHLIETGRVGRAKGVNDGDGFVFISHRGEIYPSGFLPVSAGNVRTDDLVEVYRTHDLFRALRDRDRLEGKCGACEYRSVCGGSRARAYAMTGDVLEISLADR